MAYRSANPRHSRGENEKGLHNLTFSGCRMITSGDACKLGGDGWSFGQSRAGNLQPFEQ
jgi:hypothetical protein